MRVTRYDPSASPVSKNGPPQDTRQARALPGDPRAASGWTSGARAERIEAPSFGVARMLELYRENETPYVPPRRSSFHVRV